MPETMVLDEVSQDPACCPRVAHNLVNPLGDDASHCGLTIRPGELPAREDETLFEEHWGPAVLRT